MALWVLGLMLLGQAAPVQADDAPRPELVGDMGVVFGPSNYPPAAIRAREQGRVVADLTVDRQGQVTDCRIVESAAASLAEQTCHLAVSNTGLFRAARDRRGATVASHYRLRIHWQLPDGGRESDTVRASDALLPATLRVTVEPDGRVLSCYGGLPMDQHALPLGHAVCTGFARQIVEAVTHHSGRPPVQRLEGRFFVDYAPSLAGHAIPAWPRDMVVLNDMNVSYVVTPEKKRVNCQRDLRVWEASVPMLIPCGDETVVAVDPSWRRENALFRMGYRVLGSGR